VIQYPRHRCNTRFAIFFGGATLAGAFSGLLAYGIGFLQAGFPQDDGTDKGWRWIFIIEGKHARACGRRKPQSWGRSSPRPARLALAQA